MTEYTKYFRTEYAKNKIKGLEYNDDNVVYLYFLYRFEIYSISIDKPSKWFINRTKKYESDWNEIKKEMKLRFPKNSGKSTDELIEHSLIDKNEEESIKTWKLMGGTIK